MKPVPSLYPPRRRTTNIELIKNLLSAQTAEEFEAADEAVARNLHPSLLAELDWMEMTIPDSQQVGGKRLVDGLFIHHLSSILSLRKIEFSLSDEDIHQEISENLDFYSDCLRDETRPLDALGEDLSQRIQSIVKTAVPKIDEAILRWCEVERSRIVGLFSNITDPNWLLLLIDVEIKNALALSLDHLSSRIQAKEFLRHIGGQFPDIGISSIQSQQDLNLLLERLGKLDRLARKFNLFRLVGVCCVLHELFKNAEASRLQESSSELAAGYGLCGRCSMMYASSAIISFDPTCPGLFNAEGDTIYFPLDFNVSICPFCGDQKREEAPSMFYSPYRHQIIYNYPRLGQFTEDEARQIHRSVITAIRERYMKRVSDEETRQFESANEEFTYSAAEFLYAIQMGTTVNEEHVSVLVRLFDGSGVIFDKTKGAIISLTHAEMATEWAQGRMVDIHSALEAGGPSMKEAVEAFAEGQYERSRDILEQLHKKHPGDDNVRRNLAAAYVKLGDIESARKVIKG